MVNIFLFLSGFFFLTFIIGSALERFIKVPWIFASLLIGVFLAINNPFAAVTSSSIFNFLAQLGMYFLLFIIGLELDVDKLIAQGRFIVSATIAIIATETIFGSLLVHFVFNYSWHLSFLIALSFATVGEAVLIPILEEFKMVNSNLGQAIIGIGTLDDIAEILTLIIVAVLVLPKGSDNINLGLLAFALSTLFILFAISMIAGRLGYKVSLSSREILFLLSLALLFLYLGVSSYGNAEPLAALLAGIAARALIPPSNSEFILSTVKAVGFGFLAPLFFGWVGMTMNMSYLFRFPLLVFLVILVSSTAKLLSSYLVGRKKLGNRPAILLGIGLSVRFSTSLIIMKLLHQHHLIKTDIYSVIIASSIILVLVVPVVFSLSLHSWKSVLVEK